MTVKHIASHGTRYRAKPPPPCSGFVVLQILLDFYNLSFELFFLSVFELKFLLLWFKFTNKKRWSIETLGPLTGPQIKQNPTALCVIWRSPTHPPCCLPPGLSCLHQGLPVSNKLFFPQSFVVVIVEGCLTIILRTMSTDSDGMLIFKSSCVWEAHGGPGECPRHF